MGSAYFASSHLRNWLYRDFFLASRQLCHYICEGVPARRGSVKDDLSLVTALNLANNMVRCKEL